jgi:hypothetical protein
MFNQDRVANVIIVLLAFSLCLALFVAVTLDSNMSPQVVVRKGDPLTGTPGVTIGEEGCESSGHIFLFNGTQIGPISGLHLTSGGVYVRDTSQGPDGLRVTLRSYGREHVYMEYHCPLHFVVGNYSSANASLTVQSLVGVFNISLTVYWQYPNSSGWTEGSNSTSVALSAGQGGQVALNIPIQAIQSTASSLIVSMDLYIAIQSIIPTYGVASLLIRNLAVEGESQCDLSPVHFDLQTMNGSSIYSNPYSVDLWKPPIMNLTRQSDGTHAVFVLGSVNDTLYLPADNYTAQAGWPQKRTEFGAWTPQVFSFEVKEDRMAFVAVRLPTIRVSFSSQPMLFVSLLRVEAYPSDYYSIDYLSDYYFLDDVTGELPQALYLPGHRITFEGYVDEEVPWHDWTNRAETRPIESDGSANFEVSITYPCIVVAGVAMTSSDLLAGILLFVFIGAIALEVSPTLLARTGKRLLLSPETTVFLFVLVSPLFPWFTYDESSAFMLLPSYHGGLNQGAIMIPFPFVVEEMRLGPALLSTLGTWTAALALFLFWLPMLLWFASLREKRTTRRLLVPWPLIFPVPLALLSLLWGFFLGLSLDIGIYLVLVSPFVYLVLARIRIMADRASTSAQVGTPQA